MIEYAVQRHPDAIAETSIELWTLLFAELGTIIGERGVSSLYARNLHQVRTRQSWLTPVVHTDGVGLEQLRTDLHAQADASVPSADLLNTFIDTLILLIGELLTSSILRKAWGDDVVNDAGTELH
jgi:hypothetical protein